MAVTAYPVLGAESLMPTKTDADDQTKAQSLWRRLDRFLIRGSRFEVAEDDDGDESSDFKIKPGWTIKGL